MQRLVLLAFCVTLLGIAAHAQQEEMPKTIADSVGDVLRYTQEQFLSLAKAMPEDKYGFIPAAGNFKDARSFGEQVKHVACANNAFFKEIEGKPAPELCER
jgi:hypothetical protein